MLAPLEETRADAVAAAAGGLHGEDAVFAEAQRELILNPDGDDGEEDDDNNDDIDVMLDGSYAPGEIVEVAQTILGVEEGLGEESDDDDDSHDEGEGDDLQMETESWKMALESALELEIPLVPLPTDAHLPNRYLQKNSFVFVFCGGREWELVQISCPLEGGGYRFKVVSIGDFAVAVFTEDNQGRDLESEFKWVHLKRK